MAIELPAASTAGVVAAAGYLAGSIPFGYLAARARGVDIRAVGSGNIGATNVKRACGPAVGRIVLLLDIAKGLVPTAILAPWIAARMGEPGAATAPAMCVAALATIGGHNWPVWLAMKGGKGVATTIGAFAALLHWWIFVPLAVWAIVARATGYVSVASMALGCAIAATAGGLLAAGRAEACVLAAAVVAALLMVTRHRANISRLAAGTEPKRGEVPGQPGVRGPAGEGEGAPPDSGGKDE